MGARLLWIKFESTGFSNRFCRWLARWRLRMEMLLQQFDQRQGRWTQRAGLRIDNGQRPAQGLARNWKRLYAQRLIVGRKRAFGKQRNTKPSRDHRLDCLGLGQFDGDARSDLFVE